MNNKYIILAVLCVIASFRISAQQNQTSKVELPIADLKALDKVILESKKYEDAKLSDIDSLKKLLGNPINISDVRYRWELNMEIGEQYKPLSSDSALYYFEKARNVGVETGSDSLMLKSRIAVLDALSGAGIFTEAVSELEALESLPMPKSLQLEQ